MRNIKLTIEYDGTGYGGWQVQNRRRIPGALGHKVTKSQGHPPRRTIQLVIEKALAQLLQEKVKLIGSGRTDAGVHALAQTAHFTSHSRLSADTIMRGLNALLPADIVVTKAEEAALKFHSRFNAALKTYRYTILNRPYRSAIWRNSVYHCWYPLDMRRMQKEARELVGTHDFKSFQARAGKERGSVRTITKINISKKKDLIFIDITANGFLYNMMRSIAGTLIEIGRGRFPAGSMNKIVRARDRKRAGPTAPACGLCLMRVRY